MGLVGGLAPSFKANAVINGGESVKDFSLDQFLNQKYVILFFYPKDFTFVCPSELHAFQTNLAEFEKRNCVVIGCSTDTAETHWGWLQVPKEKGGIKGITYPLIADSDKLISDAYDVLNGEYDYNEEGELVATGSMIAYRGLFLIDKEGVVQHQLVNNLPLGRNVDDGNGDFSFDDSNFDENNDYRLVVNKDWFFQVVDTTITTRNLNNEDLRTIT